MPCAAGLEHDPDLLQRRVEHVLDVREARALERCGGGRTTRGRARARSFREGRGGGVSGARAWRRGGGGSNATTTIVSGGETAKREAKPSARACAQGEASAAVETRAARWPLYERRRNSPCCQAACSVRRPPRQCRLKAPSAPRSVVRHTDTSAVVKSMGILAAHSSRLARRTFGGAPARTDLLINRSSKVASGDAALSPVLGARRAASCSPSRGALVAFPPRVARATCSRHCRLGSSGSSPRFLSASCAGAQGLDSFAQERGSHHRQGKWGAGELASWPEAFCIL